MRVCIAGSRVAPEPVLMEVMDYVEALPPGTTVVHGGASGVDTAAHLAAKGRGLDAVPVRPSGYGRYGRAAPLWRNARMAGMVDHCVVFWCRGSRGSENMIANAYAAGVPVEVYVYD